METEAERIARQGRFAEYVLAQPEWSEMLIEVKDAVVNGWIRASTTELRENEHAKMQALGAVNGLMKQWDDRKKSQEIVAAQDTRISAT